MIALGALAAFACPPVLPEDTPIEVIDVLVHPAADVRNRLDIEVIYRIKDTNDRRNLVHPFYTIPDDGSDY